MTDRFESASAVPSAPARPRSSTRCASACATDYRLGVITNDIFTREDMEFLVRSEALPPDRIIGVQTGGCPHTAIREDASMNFDALDELTEAPSRSRLRVSRERRRQSRRELQPRAGGRVDLRHRRLGRRQDSAQGRPGRDAIRPAGHQQDRSCAARRRRPRASWRAIRS